MKYLVTGSNGQVGSSVMNQVEDSTGLDIEDSDIVRDISQVGVIDDIVEENPDVVVHAAAMTDLDEAEKNPERATRINVDGTRNVCKAAERIGAHLIYVSTDYVFDGERGDYTEEDEANPISEYARTKWEGEEIVRNSDTRVTVLRTSVVFDGGHSNFFTWAKSELQEKGEVGAITDQVNQPTYAPNLANMIIEAGEKEITGLYHATGNSRVTRYEAVQIMKDELGLGGEVKKMNMEDLPWDAHRPKDSSLCLAKLKQDFETQPISISEAFNRMYG